MNAIKTHKGLAIFFAFLIVGALAWAQGVNRESFQTTRGTIGTHTSAPTKIFDDVSAVTSALWSTTPTTARRTNGNPKIAMVLTSNDPSDTVEVTMGRYHYDGSTFTFMGVADVQVITLTGTVTMIEGGTGVFWSADDIEWDTQGIHSVDFRITGTAPSGVINGYIWGYGVTPALPAN